MVLNELEKNALQLEWLYSLKPVQLCTKKAHTAMIAHGCYHVHQTHILAPEPGFPVYVSPEARCCLLLSAFYTHEL